MSYREPFNEELYHYGILGMKWGKRKAKDTVNSSKIKKNKYSRVVAKKGEKVTLNQTRDSITAKILVTMFPSLKKKMDAYQDYKILSKDGKIVGNVSTNVDNKNSMNIVWISIKDKHSGQGYGQSAMRTVINDAKKRGFKELTLEVPTISPNARHIYEKLGFKETDDGKAIYDENDIWGGLTNMKMKL